jgi:UDP-N-acetylmuramoyl-L-alanyl-D-glutamate--2,6-diaminopimelate ligase
MNEKMLRTIEKLLPRSLYRTLQPVYHFSLATAAAFYYGFPSRHLAVILVTGTKGKTSTTEILNNILEASGAKTAVLGTLRFKVGDKNERNMRKMTIPGRFFVQRFLSRAVQAGCTHAIIEMTSEGAKQFRQRFIDMDALIFTNLAPEHIESHGSYEKYRDAKLSIARTLGRSAKPHHFMIANVDDKEGERFLDIPGVEPLPYSQLDAEPFEVSEQGLTFTFKGKQISSSLPGIFNMYNMLGAATCAFALNISLDAIALGIKRTTRIEGRMEMIDEGQGFPVIVDYAHTPDSLEAVYIAYKNYDKVCILGNTGGGRDKWKRPVMGKIAEDHCAAIILTNEDPYDEDPSAILEEIKSGMKTKTPEIIIDRRKAVARALRLVKELKHPAVLITGKGTDPYIMGPHGTKEPWDDRRVAREELGSLLGKK